MPFIEKSTCEFHRGITRPNLLLSLQERAVVFDLDQPLEAVGSVLQDKNIHLIQRIHDWQDILICAGCYKRLRGGEAAIDTLHFKSAFLWIEYAGKEGHLRTLELRDKEKARFCVLGDLNRSTDRDRSFGLLTPDDSFTKDIRFVIPTKENLPLVFSTERNYKRPLRTSTSSDAFVAPEIAAKDVAGQQPRRVSATPTASQFVGTEGTILPVMRRTSPPGLPVRPPTAFDEYIDYAPQPGPNSVPPGGIANMHPYDPPSSQLQQADSNFLMSMSQDTFAFTSHRSSPSSHSPETRPHTVSPVGIIDGFDAFGVISSNSAVGGIINPEPVNPPLNPMERRASDSTHCHMDPTSGNLPRDERPVVPNHKDKDKKIKQTKEEKVNQRGKQTKPPSSTTLDANQPKSSLAETSALSQVTALPGRPAALNELNSLSEQLSDTTYTRSSSTQLPIPSETRASATRSFDLSQRSSSPAVERPSITQPNSFPVPDPRKRSRNDIDEDDDEEVFEKLLRIEEEDNQTLAELEQEEKEMVEIMKKREAERKRKIAEKQKRLEGIRAKLKYPKVT